MEDQNVLLKELQTLYNNMLVAEQAQRELLKQVKPARYNSAVNLVDYLSLRSSDIEQLQERLHALSLSSLTHSESHIKSQLIRLMHWLGHDEPGICEVDAASGCALLNENVKDLLGEGRSLALPPVMVTFDTHFADDFELLCHLLDNGMQIARINCAHDDQDTWKKMIANLDKAREKTGWPCKVYMDLAGPKIRTQIISKKHRHGKLEVELNDEVLLTEASYKPEKHHKVVACTLEAIIPNLKPGQRVFFDDGLFEAVVERIEDDKAVLSIKRISAKKPVIKSEKGINFPDTDFKVDPITEYDQECLQFIVKHADMLGFSFVNSAADMKRLQEQLSELDAPDFPVIAKIETNQSVNNLPAIILQGIQRGNTGVMIARGDMAIEIGFERMSEIQDEILWICEAAHVPVIWATQVLETMHKNGIATRSEITDAAHAATADCVMINKGQHTVAVLKSLNDILTRSRRNNFKNRRLFRKLSIAEKFIRNN